MKIGKILCMQILCKLQFIENNIPNFGDEECENPNKRAHILANILGQFYKFELVFISAESVFLRL